MSLWIQVILKVEMSLERADLLDKPGDLFFVV